VPPPSRTSCAAFCRRPRTRAGNAYGSLRETRMAAVVCELVDQGDVTAMRNVVARAGDVSRAIVRGVGRGVEERPDS